MDGQQRLTTIFLFLARIRDEIGFLGETRIKAQTVKERDIDVENPILDFLYGEGNPNTEPRYEANALLQKLGHTAFSPLDTDSNERDIPRRSREIDKAATLPFRNAYWQIKELVCAELAAQENSENRLLLLHNLTQGFLDRLKVLPITTSNREESLNVFMTINDRGLPLGVFDLVRGQVLKALTTSLAEDKKKKVFVETLSDWEQILDDVEGSKPDQFLRHHLLSERTEKLTMKSVPAAVGDMIDMSSTGFQQRAEEFWNNVKVSAGIYDTVLRPTIKGPSKQRLECLRMIADSYRLVALRILHPNSSLEFAEQEELIRLVFVSVIRWNIDGRNAQELESELQKACQPLVSRGGYGASREILARIAGVKCDFERFFNEGVSTNWSKSLLLALESELSGKASGLDVSKLHLEHIAPQKSTPHWQQVFSEDSRSYSDLVSDIGNLTILDSGLNMKVKQQPFAEKTLEYKKSRSNITNDCCELKTWDASVIKHRNQWIIQSLEKILQVEPAPIALFTEWQRNQN